MFTLHDALRVSLCSRVDGARNPDEEDEGDPTLKCGMWLVFVQRPLKLEDPLAY